ncbi:hypothetical protein WT81_05565 [Burkholderia stagnalis]|nr:hypothetical protein WT80_18120 [Burkholderia stagnalis]KWK66733.1 hypothetical protein WT81_05565 [Burkholderia stagnalis]KWN73456.1 hypothetical protein WT90_15965 [Burkholderia stagnalis]
MGRMVSGESTMPDAMLHVLHVGPKQPGGINSVLRELDARRDAFGRHGIAFSFFETRGFKRMRDRALFVAVDVPRFLMVLSGPVDVVHFHVAVRGSFYRKYVLFVLARMLGRKTVIHMHSGEFDPFFRQSPGIGQAIVRHFVRRAHAAIGVSRATGAELAAHGKRTGALYVIGNAAHAAEAAGGPATDDAPGRRPYIAFVGKLTVLKGVDDLLAALSILKRRGCGVELRLAGSGDLDAWRGRAAAHDVADAVRFMGWLDGDAKFAFLRDAGLFCMPSHFESFGIATLEAMLCGLPVVGTRLGGFLDLVREGETGFLVEPRDPVALADRIGALVADRPRAKAMGAAGLAHARACYSTQVITGRYVDVYRDLRNSGGGMPGVSRMDSR